MILVFCNRLLDAVTEVQDICNLQSHDECVVKIYRRSRKWCHSNASRPVEMLQARDPTRDSIDLR